MDCTYMRSDWSIVTRAARFAFREAAAPLVRASAAVSALCRSVMAALNIASAGEGLGKLALPVIPVTTPLAYVMRTLMRLGRSRTAKLLCALVVEVANGMISYLCENTAVTKRKK